MTPEHDAESCITKRDRPMGKPSPGGQTPGSWFGRDRDIIEIRGDLTEPVDVEWAAETNPERVLDP